MAFTGHLMNHSCPHAQPCIVCKIGIFAAVRQTGEEAIRKFVPEKTTDYRNEPDTDRDEPDTDRNEPDTDRNRADQEVVGQRIVLITLLNLVDAVD